MWTSVNGASSCYHSSACEQEIAEKAGVSWPTAFGGFDQSGRVSPRLPCVPLYDASGRPSTTSRAQTSVSREFASKDMFKEPKVTVAVRRQLVATSVRMPIASSQLNAKRDPSPSLCRILRQRILPGDARESGEIAVDRTQREAMLDGERRQMRIGDEAAGRPRGLEQQDLRSGQRHPYRFART